MARNIATLLLIVAASGSCMETRETVERMVMVRTTGSDLQPAATGYIYKKESDRPASVVTMGESEVIEHFSKIYGKPEAYKAPVPAPAGPFYGKEDEDKAASHTSEEQVKPVVEHANEQEEPIDGIANEDYDKIFEEYAKEFGGYGAKNDYGDYLHGPGHFDHDIYHGYGGGKDYDSKGYHGYGGKGHEGFEKQHHYNKGNAKDYHTEKHEGFSVSKEGGHKGAYDEADEHGKHYEHGHGYKGNDHGHKSGHSKGEGVNGFHKIYDSHGYKKDHDFYDGKAHEGGHHKYGNGHAHHGSDAGGFKEGDTHESGHHKGDFGKGGFVKQRSGDEHDEGHSSEQEGQSAHNSDGDFGAKTGKYDGKSYGYEIKH